MVPIIAERSRHGNCINPAGINLFGSKLTPAANTMILIDYQRKCAGGLIRTMTPAARIWSKSQSHLQEKKEKSLPLSYFDLCCNITQCLLCCPHNTVFCKTSSKEWDARHIDIPNCVNSCCISIR
jgi:hypothetical protein